MAYALVELTRGPSTCSILGQRLTGRKSSIGLTLHALRRRGLVSCSFDGHHWVWRLTVTIEVVQEMIRGIL